MLPGGSVLTKSVRTFNSMPGRKYIRGRMAWIASKMLALPLPVS
jgi:hypothetical protein